MFEDDVRIVAQHAAHLFAQAAPLTLVLGVLVGPEPVTLGLAVDDELATHCVEELGPLRRRNHTHRSATTVEHQLGGVGADAAGGAPNEHVVTLLHASGVVTHQHSVGRGRTQCIDRRLLPTEVGGLGHQLIGLHDRQVGQTTEVGFKAPDSLVGRLHRIVVCRMVLIIHVVAVHRHPVAGLPVAHGRPHLHHHAGGIRADHVVIEGVTLAPHRLLAQTVEERKGRERLKDRRPHRVEVDRAGHDRQVHLVGGQLGCGHLVDVQGFAGVLIGRLVTVPHRLLLAQHVCRPVALGNGQVGDVLAGGVGLDGVENLLHSCKVTGR